MLFGGSSDAPEPRSSTPTAHDLDARGRGRRRGNGSAPLSRGQACGGHRRRRGGAASTARRGRRLYYWSAAARPGPQTLSAPIPSGKGRRSSPRHSRGREDGHIVGGIDGGAPSVVYDRLRRPFNTPSDGDRVDRRASSRSRRRSMARHLLTDKLVVFRRQNAAGTVLDGTSQATRSGATCSSRGAALTPRTVARREGLRDFTTTAQGYFRRGNGADGGRRGAGGSAWSHSCVTGGRNTTARRATRRRSTSRTACGGGGKAPRDPAERTGGTDQHRPDISDPEPAGRRGFRCPSP